MNGETYMGHVAQLSCGLCLRLGLATQGAVEVHHRRAGTGGGKKASDYDTMPLCFPHHREHPGAFHVLGTKRFVATYGITEQELIEDARKRMGFAEEVVQGWKDAATAARKRKKSSGVIGPKVAKEAREPKLVSQKGSVSSRGMKSPSTKAKIGSAGFSKPVGKVKWPSRKLESRNTLRT